MKKHILITLCLAFCTIVVCSCKKKAGTERVEEPEQLPLSRLNEITDSLNAVADSLDKANEAFEDSIIAASKAGNTHNDSDTPSTYSPKPIPYNDGYLEGMHDGKRDGVVSKKKKSYDDSTSDYCGREARQYAEGYADGYKSGYLEGEADAEFQRGFDAGFYREHLDGYDSENYDPELDDF